MMNSYFDLSTSCVLFQREWDVDSDYPWSFAIASFNPCQCDFAPLEVNNAWSGMIFRKERL